MNRRFPLIALALALAGAGGIWLLEHIEYGPKRVWTGYQGEARHNPWLAAERLLARMGLEVHHLRGVPELADLPQEATLLLTARRSILSDKDRARLLKWADEGGHLVVEAEPVGNADPLLDDLEVARKELKEKEGGKRRRGKPKETFSLHLPRASVPVQLSISDLQQMALETKRSATRGAGPAATVLLHFRRGKGMVTVLAAFDFARNSSIGDYDHAEFVWQLAALQPDAEDVFLFDSPRKLSLAAWLVEHAWAVLAALALFLVLWLWRIVPRFGPVAPDPEPVRRRLLDHLRASGRFQWSAGGAELLSGAAREALLRRLAQVQPDFTALSAAEREQRLAAGFALTPAEARLALAEVRVPTPAALVTVVGLYRRIHERLSHHSRKDRA